MIFDLLNFELGRFRSRKKVFEKNFFSGLESETRRKRSLSVSGSLAYLVKS